MERDLGGRILLPLCVHEVSKILAGYVESEPQRVVWLALSFLLRQTVLMVVLVGHTIWSGRLFGG
jgi:hypothetical protein